MHNRDTTDLVVRLFIVSHVHYLSQVWDFETIDAADSANESGTFEMDCMNELKVGNDVHLISMVKSLDPEVQSIWYAQVSPHYPRTNCMARGGYSAFGQCKVPSLDIFFAK